MKPLAPKLTIATLLTALLTACASTQTTVAPSPQAPLCDASASALVIWAPAWRADQKDVPAREAAAAAGLRDFFASSGCFARVALQRVAAVEPAAARAQAAAATAPFSVLLGVEVRELGPVLKLLSSPALVEGGTEVQLRLLAFDPADAALRRAFTLQWRHGGAGVVKGVASLPADMQSALRVALQPGGAP